MLFWGSRVWEGVCKKSMFCTLVKMMKKMDDPLGVIHCFIIIASVGERGPKTDKHSFQNLKMTVLFHQNHHFIGFFLFVHFWGGLQKEYVLYARENNEKIADDPLHTCQPS